jgi:large subunit ribosomal protein L21
MFAVIKTGGKQYKVGKGDVLSIEKLDGDAGAEIRFDKVLLVGDGASQTVGAPLVDGAAVTATVLEQAKADKILVFKKNRRHRYKRTQGHRQRLTVVRIEDILPSGAKKRAAAPKAAAKKAEASSEAEAAPKAAAKSDEEN